MDLYLLRHAIAVKRGTEGYDTDSERPLTPKGESRMRDIARGMRALDLSCDLIFSSPYLRARQTAEIVAETFKDQEKVHISTALAPDGDAKKLIEELNKRYRSRQSIVLVGHEPYLSALISTLVTGDGNVVLVMKKGGLCKLSVGSLQFGRCAALAWLLTPRQLRSLR